MVIPCVNTFISLLIFLKLEFAFLLLCRWNFLKLIFIWGDTFYKLSGLLKSFSLQLQADLSSDNVMFKCCLNINFSLLRLFNKWIVYFYNVWIHIYMHCIWWKRTLFAYKLKFCMSSFTSETCIKLGKLFWFLLNEFVTLMFGEIVEFL